MFTLEVVQHYSQTTLYSPQLKPSAAFQPWLRRRVGHLPRPFLFYSSRLYYFSRVLIHDHEEGSGTRLAYGGLQWKGTYPARMSNTKVALIKRMSIPRLEICGAQVFTLSRKGRLPGQSAQGVTL